jgi:hypothetical protein
MNVVRFIVTTAAIFIAAWNDLLSFELLPWLVCRPNMT